MTRQRTDDPIIGARQAADLGPGEVAPIVMWSYLASLVREYDVLLARAERAHAQVQRVEALLNQYDRYEEPMPSDRRHGRVPRAEVRAALGGAE